MNVYSPSQRLNQWVEMLHDIYGHTQNYSKTPFELHAHLTEVTGVMGKHISKRHDSVGAAPFVAKAFGWAVALFVSMRRTNLDLEALILRKFPGVCPYCHQKPCGCWDGTRPTLDEDEIRSRFYKFAPGAKRTPNDFQLLFKEVYGESWGSGPDAIRTLLTRLLEELAEIGEAIRFSHLYPDNLDNEIADFFAWWFALVSTMHTVDGTGARLAEDLLWSVYPGHCGACEMIPCFCRPGPVRELVSKPLPGELNRLDRLTLAYSQGAYLDDVESIIAGKRTVAMPLACVRVDLDDFKNVNNTFGHPAGDQALRHLAGVVKQKARERDRVYRVGGDEFLVLCPDYSGEEATGLMQRAAGELARKRVRWVSDAGDVAEFSITMSVGVATCEKSSELKSILEAADKAAYASKEKGKNTITLYKAS